MKDLVILMKTFTFKNEKNPKKSALESMKRAIITGKFDVHDHELVCDSIEPIKEIISLSVSLCFDNFDLLQVRYNTDE